MPNYVNPYMQSIYQPQMGYSGAPYANSTPVIPQQSYGQQMQQPAVRSMEWVEGEIGAKAFQIPAGWPANTPIALWDSTDTAIYLKSVNQMGVPNPLQKLKYTIEEQPNAMLMSGNQPGTAAAEHSDMSQYVTKSDLDALRQEIKSLATAGNQGNGKDRGNNQNNGRSGNA